MTKIAIVTNHCINGSKNITENLKSVLKNNALDYDELDLENLKGEYDLVCAIGGDGTMLKTLRYYSKSQTPVMGINIGRLGFLSLISPDKVKDLGDIILNKQYSVKERIMLNTDGKTALNDIVIKGHSKVRSSKFNLYINDVLMSEYIADGIIVSTPTGSTAYGLSAGGPILYPGLEGIVIVPICAHTMTARPLVIPTDEKLTIKSTDELLDVACDGQENILGVNEVKIELSKYRAKLAIPKDVDFYTVLKNKLYWGMSPLSN